MGYASGTRHTVVEPAIFPARNTHSSGVPQYPISPGLYPATMQTLRPQGCPSHGILPVRIWQYTGASPISQAAVDVAVLDTPPVAVLAPPTLRAVEVAVVPPVLTSLLVAAVAPPIDCDVVPVVLPPESTASEPPTALCCTTEPPTETLDAPPVARAPELPPESNRATESAGEEQPISASDNATSTTI
jgi:hypothetical protein